MRYCVKCGKELKDERFCTGCGADNGVPAPSTPTTAPAGGMPGAAITQSIGIDTILHWLTIALFAVTALLQLVTCLKNENYITSYSMMYSGGIILAVVYFIIGMWAVVPAVSFILNANKGKGEAPAVMALVMLVLVIVLAIVKAIAKNISALTGIAVILNPYTNKMTRIIVFSVLTIGSYIAQRYLAATGRR